MADATLADYDRWTPNATGTLRRRGEVRPDDCPRGRDECDGCRAFMGHRKDMPAYAGEAVRFCCADRF